MRVLVAGGAGFIGSTLCRSLLDSHHDVWCIDNLMTGRMENIESLLRHPSFVFLRRDIRDFTVPSFIEMIYNLACPASPVAYQNHPIETLMTSVEGTHKLLVGARRNGARFLQASTSEVYGCPTRHPQTEDYWGNVNPTGPRACYDEGKRAAEALCADFRRVAKVDVRIARIFNTYGPRMAADDGRVVSEFIVRALRGDVPIIYGTGDQTRSFCYVDDTVDGLVRLMANHHQVESPVNIGNPHEITMIELAQIVMDVTGSWIPIGFRLGREDDPERRQPDIRLAQSLLGWSPKIGIEEGVALTLEYFRSKGESHVKRELGGEVPQAQGRGGEGGPERHLDAPGAAEAGRGL